MARRSSKPAAGYERLLAAAFREAGWSVDRQARLGRYRPDLLVRSGKLAYVVKVKSAAEGRRDRVIPLLAQAVLQARAMARESAVAVPLAVIGSPRIPEALAGEISRFAGEFAPEAAVGVIDLEGFRAFYGAELESLNAPRRPGRAIVPKKIEPRPNLFSDLNQWMLKVLLASHIPESFLSAPRGQYRNASELARAAGVSVMSAFRLLRLLAAEGFLDESIEPLRLVRVEELMLHWRAAYLRPVREWPMRWILRGDPDEKLAKALGSGSLQLHDKADARLSRKRSPLPRSCLGLFAAADALGLGFVHGIKPHIHLDQFGEEHLRHLGLMRVDPGDHADVYVRVPSAPQSVFRGAVFRNGIPVSDVLQIWADVSSHPSRGEAQAAEIERGALRSLFERAR